MPRLKQPPLTLNAWLRYDLIMGTLRRLPGVERILEVGCGKGALGVRLANKYSYVGLEPDAQCFATAQQRLGQMGDGRVLQADISAMAPGETFDVICAFEVLEHIEDDVGVLSRWIQHLRPGGWVIVSTPAFSARYASADSMAGHFRRYDPQDMRELFTEAGLLHPEVQTYGFPPGLLLEATRNHLAAKFKTEKDWEARTAASGRWIQPPDNLAWLTFAAALPLRLLQRPFLGGKRGTGLVGSAQKPG